MKSLQEAVERGAAWLDAHAPGWIDKIDLDNLGMGSQYDCILGQVFGHFSLAVERWAPALGRWCWCKQHGFDGEYPLALSMTWAALVLDRRAAAVNQ